MPIKSIDNFYQPQTAVGQGIANIANAMFAGESPNQEADRIARQQLNQAHARAYGAQTDLAQAQADLARNKAQTELDNANYYKTQGPLDIATSVFGTKPAAQQYLKYRETGSWGQEPNIGAMTGSMDMQDAPMVESAAPSFFTPELAGKVQQFMQALSLDRSAPGNSNASQLGKLLETLYSQNIQSQAMNGQFTPQQATDLNRANVALKGGQLFNGGAGGVTSYDVSSGAINDPGQYGSAKTAAELANALFRQAGARERDAQAEYNRAGVGERQARAGYYKEKASTGPAEKTYGVNLGDIEDEIKMQLPQGNPVDPVALSRIRELAVQNATRSRNIPGAVRAALEGVQLTDTDVPTERKLFSPSTWDGKKQVRSLPKNASGGQISPTPRINADERANKIKQDFQSGKISREEAARRLAAL